MILQINLFTSYLGRFQFTKLALDQLTKIKPENKELISLHVYFNTKLKDMWVKELTKEKYSDIDIVLHMVDNDEYIIKLMADILGYTLLNPIPVSATQQVVENPSVPPVDGMSVP